VIDVDGVPHRIFQRALAPRSGFPPAYQVGLYSMAESLARQRALRGWVLAAGGVALLLGLVLSLVIARSLAVPIRELATAAAEIGGGSLAVTVRVRSDDEIGRLAAAFNDMVAGLVLKEKYRSLLDLVADRDVAEHLLAGRLTLGGELRDASILFCDIRGFTTLTETMPPAEVIELLNEHMSALTRVVHANGGAVDKFVGDALIALFGAPRTTGSDAHHAVWTAWQMVAARTALNQTGRHPLAVGVGIASGTVVAGCMGSNERLEYTVLGARVNLAARLCAQAGPMEVLVDDTTREQLGDALVAELLPPLQLKGFRTPVAAWRVTDVRAFGSAP
jgi:class 3 adenylate cyclase